MQTRITARQVEISDGLRAHIENSVEKLGRYYDGIHGAHVALKDEDPKLPTRTAEVTLTVRRNQLRAQGSATTHTAAVDACVRQLRRQVLRYKDRLRDTSQDRHR